jgi:protein SCO1
VRRLLTVTVALLAVLLTGCGTTSPQSPVANVSMSDTDGLHGIVMPTAYDVPNTVLTDSEGAAYHLRSDTTKPLTLVYFGYIHCPDICQVVMANLASAVTRLDPAQQAKVGMLFVTTDPARDDAASLRAYLDRFNPSFEGLTGPLPRIVAAGKALGVPIEKGAKMPSGGYEVSHGTQVMGVLPDGTAPVVWTESSSPADIADDINTILDQGVPQAEGGQ